MHIVGSRLLFDRELLFVIHETVRGSSLIKRDQMSLFIELPIAAGPQSTNHVCSSPPSSQRLLRLDALIEVILALHAS